MVLGFLKDSRLDDERKRTDQERERADRAISRAERAEADLERLRAISARRSAGPHSAPGGAQW